MTAFVSGLWTITKGAWLTATLLVLLRLTFHKALSPKAKYYLWLLLALRLILPVLPESPLSLHNFVPTEPPAKAVEAVQEDIPAPEASVIPIEQPEAETAPNAAEPVTDTTVSIPVLPETPPVEEAHRPDPEMILFWVWLGGAVLVLLIQLFLYLLTALRLHRLPCCTDPDTLRVYLRLKKALRIGGSPRLVSGGAGMLGGLFHPAIVLPPERHGEDAGPILLHELTHYKYGDLWLSALYRLLSAVYWFNPVVWLCFHWAISDSEAACDQRVLETGLVDAASYAEVLYEEGVLHMKRGILPQTTFGGRRHSLKRRILGIAGFRSPKLYVAVLAAALALVIAACSLTDAVTRQEEDPILTAFLAAEETLLQTDAQDAERNPADLTEEEIDSIVDTYNQRFDTYFVEDIYPVTRTKENYEGYLRGENFGNSYCFVRSGILSFEADCKQTGETAEITADVVSYQLLIDYDPYASQFYIGCSAYRNSITAGMILEDGHWKVQSRYADILDEWSPGPEIQEVGYETAEAAIAAAKELDVEALCPLKADLSSSAPASPSAAVADGKSLYAIKDGQITFLGFDWTTPIDDIRSAYPDWHVDETYGHMDSGRDPFGKSDPVHNIMLQCPPLYGNHFMTANVWYDRERASFDALLEQRTLELGPPTEQEEKRAVWTLGNSVLILTGRTGTSGPTEYLHPADIEGFEETALEAKRVYAPYRTSGNAVTFEDTLWNMRPSQVVQALPSELAENIAYEITENEEKPVLRGKAPLATHPEVKDVYFRFNFITDSLSMELVRVETHYDPEQVSYEQLVAQRIEELGPPDDSYENGARWDFGGVHLDIYPDRDGSHQEWLTRDYTHYDPELMKDADISSYLEAIQPSIGRYGWTLAEHVEAGLLDLEQGTLEALGESNSHTFTTEVDLGGYGPLTATYVFTETMAGLGSGREVLTEINVELPEGVPLSTWLSGFTGPWRDWMLASQNVFHTPFCVGALLSDTQREAIADNLLAWDTSLTTREEALNYLDNWRFAGAFYDTPRGFVLNGTGAALYTVAQGME